MKRVNKISKLQYAHVGHDLSRIRDLQLPKVSQTTRRTSIVAELRKQLEGSHLMHAAFDFPHVVFAEVVHALKKLFQ